MRTNGEMHSVQLELEAVDRATESTSWLGIQGPAEENGKQCWKHPGLTLTSRGK